MATGSRSVRIVVLDDDPIVADLIGTVLERAYVEFSVDRFTDADEALAALSRSVDCVVCDYHLDGTDGFAVLEAVRTDYPDLPFVVTTSESDGTLAREALDRGADDYLQKTLDPHGYERLAARVAQLVGDRTGGPATGGEAAGDAWSALGCLSAGAYAIDAEWRLTFVSEAVLAETGRPRDELLGRRLQEAFPDVAGTPLEARFEAAMTADEPTTVEWYCPARAEPIDITAIPTGDGLAVRPEPADRLRDIDEREQLRRLTRNVPVVLFELDADGAITQSTGKGLEGLETSPDEVLGGSVFDVHADNDAVVAAAEDALDGERVETTVAIGDAVFDAIYQPLFDDAGAVDRVIGVAIDVTGRERAERALDRQDQRLQALVGNVPIILFEFDDRGVIQEARGRGFERFGTDPASAIGESVFDRYAGAPEITEACRRALDGEAVDATVAFGQATLDAWFRPLLDADGEIDRVVGVAVDVTERERLAAELGENEAALRDLYRIASDTDLAFDEKLRRLLEVGARRLGLPYGFVSAIGGDTHEVVASVGGHDLLAAGNRAPLEKTYCKRVLETEELVEVQNAPAEGWRGDPAYEASGLSCYVGTKVLVEEELHGTLCFAADDARERSFTDAEKRLVELLGQWVGYELERQRLEDRLRALQETSRALIVAETTEEVGRVAVETVEAVFDLPITAVWTHDPAADALRPLAGTDTSQEVVGDLPTFEAGEGLAWGSFAAGEVRAFEDVAAEPGVANPDTPIRSELHVPIGDRGLLITGSTEPRRFTDIERDLLRLLAADVEVALLQVEREELLRERERELERRNERLDEFASVVAHDLRNPLAGAMGFLEIARETGEDRHLQRVGDAHERMRQLVEDLLELARQNRRVTEERDLELDAVVEEAWSYVETPEATLAVDGDLGTVHADEARLLQLFGNLFRNAVEHAGEGVHVAVGPLEDAEGFYVADDGPGIPPEKRDEVMEYGYTTERTGTGVGLAVVGDVVDAHGWSLRITDAKGGGARFEIRTD